MMVQPFRRGLKRKKKAWCQTEKKKKKTGVSKIKNGCQTGKKTAPNICTEKWEIGINNVK